MDYNTLLAYVCLDTGILTIDDEYLDNGNVGSGEAIVKKRHSLYKKENVGLVLIGQDDTETRYTTIITDQRFIVRKGKKCISNIKWDNIISIEYSKKELVFTGKNKKTTKIPVCYLVEQGIDPDVAGVFFVSFIKTRFKLK